MTLDELNQALPSLRARQLFAPQGVNSPTTPNQGVVSPTAQDTGELGNYDVAQRMQQLYQPRTAASTAYLNQMNQMPQRVQPGALRRIGATLAGLGTGGPSGIAHGSPIGYQGNPNAALQTSQNVLNAPYNQAMQDWQERSQAMLPAMQLENQQNLSQRQVAENVIQRELEQKRLNEIQRENMHKDLEAEERTKIMRDRGDAYAFARRNPTWKPFAQPGGNLLFINPTDPTQVYDTGYNSGKMTDQDKMDFGLAAGLKKIAATGANQLANIGARGEQAQELQETKGQQTQANIAARGAEQRKTKTTAPAPITPKTTVTTVEPASGGGLFGGPAKPTTKTVTTGPAQQEPKEGDKKEIPGFPGTEQTFIKGKWIRTK